MDQEVNNIKIKDLVLWTENPRDPIDGKALDQDIVNSALNNNSGKWNLVKLAKEMGPYYDLSELPTVVYHGKKPVVYDGNRRIILGKLKHGIVKINGAEKINIPDFPEEIPCNVCSKEIALKNVLRKHGDSGSWQPLERDIFLHKYMKEEKSAFLILEESTGLISSNPHLNQRFVKEEIFNEEGLKKLGFGISNDEINTRHNKSQSNSILQDISKKIEEKEISTRKNRGKIVDVLDPSLQEVIDENKNKPLKKYAHDFTTGVEPKKATSKQTKRVNKKSYGLFGEKLFLRAGNVSNLYRDINDLYAFYATHKTTLSQLFPSLIRMSLRLLCETAAKECNMQMDKYITSHFEKAKGTLDKDSKTTLSNHNITEKSIIQLLHTGAHNYQAAANMDQTQALSIVIGAIITCTYGREKTENE